MTRKQPRRPRTLQLLGMGCAAMLAGAALTAAFVVRSSDSAAAPPELVPVELQAPESAARPVAVAASGWLRPERHELGAALLDRTFQQAQRQGTLRVLPLRDVLGDRSKVTIINVWAAYCEPCKREFAAFAERQRDWAGAVTFVPIELWDTGGGASAPLLLKEWRALFDAIPGGTIQTLLKAELPPGAPIPITLALDCRDRLRWFHAGEIVDWKEFDRVVERLRGELAAEPSACAHRPLLTRAAVVPKKNSSRPEPPGPDEPEATVEVVYTDTRPLCENEDDCSSDCRCRSGGECSRKTFRCPARPKH
jgi:thiol-disulfide isomerase/thioredoxin